MGRGLISVMARAIVVQQLPSLLGRAFGLSAGRSRTRHLISPGLNRKRSWRILKRCPWLRGPHNLSFSLDVAVGFPLFHDRSEERRVGKECRSRWLRYTY